MSDQYYASKKSDSIRKVVTETNMGMHLLHYREFKPGGWGDGDLWLCQSYGTWTGACQRTSMRSWGKAINEQEAIRRIPAIAEDVVSDEIILVSAVLNPNSERNPE